MQALQIKALTRKIVCPLCGYVGDDLSRVLEALSKVNTPPTTVKCPICNEEVNTREFVNHLMKHTHVRGSSYACGICEAKANNERTMMRHLKEHLIAAVRRGGIDVYYCLVCGQEFITKNSAIAHLMKAHEV